jgi:transposase
MDKYIGFDISGKDVSVCIVQKDQRERYATIGPDAGSMRKFLIQQRQDGSCVHLTFEISGQAGFLYDSLIDCVDSIAISNPSKMTWIYRTAKKNDRIDARKMAVLLSIGEIPAVHMPGKEVRQWRQMILHRRRIVNDTTAVKNGIRAIFKSQGLGKGHSCGWWTIKNRLWMRDLCKNINSIGELWKMQLGDMLDEMGMLEEQLKKVTGCLDVYLEKQAGGKLLMSIPGVGPRTAEAVLAYTDDVERFGGGKEYCAYFGMTPRLDESGEMRRLGHISKQGPSVVRWVLCESAWKAVRYCGAMRKFYERVKCGQPARKKTAIIAVARKLLSIMRAMLKTGEMFNEKLVSDNCWGQLPRRAA